jgi:hypothetical protein
MQSASNTEGQMLSANFLIQDLMLYDRCFYRRVKCLVKGIKANKTSIDQIENYLTMQNQY